MVNALNWMEGHVFNFWIGQLRYGDLSPSRLNLQVVTHFRLMKKWSCRINVGDVWRI